MMRRPNKCWNCCILCASVVLIALSPLLAGAGEVSWGNNSITIPLNAGTNLISIPVNPDNPSVADMFAPLGSAFIEAHTFIADSSGGPGHWISYSPTVPSFLNTLTDITAGSPLVVHMNAPGELLVEGQPLGATDLTVESGWNLLGYNGLSSYAPGDVFEFVVDSFTEVYVLVGTVWKSYSPFAPPGPDPIESIEIAEAFWLDASDTTQWFFSESQYLNIAISGRFDALRPTFW